MTVLERLNRLDDRFAPPRWRRRYDETQPLWFAFGGLGGGALGVLVAQLVVHTPAAVWAPVGVVLAAGVVRWGVAVRRWDRAHRVR